MKAKPPVSVWMRAAALCCAAAGLLYSSAFAAPVFFAAAPLRAATDEFTPQEAAESRAAGIVRTSLSITPSSVPQGGDFEVKMVATISPGYHVNAHKTSDEFLIPTSLTLQLPAGVTQKEIVYPGGKLKKLAFSDKPINVYDGVAILLVRLHAAPDGPLGSASFAIRLRYQACSDTTCLPPVNVPMRASFTIVPPGNSAGH